MCVTGLAIGILMGNENVISCHTLCRAAILNGLPTMTRRGKIPNQVLYDDRHIQPAARGRGNQKPCKVKSNMLNCRTCLSSYLAVNFAFGFSRGPKPPLPIRSGFGSRAADAEPAKPVDLLPPRWKPTATSWSTAESRKHCASRRINLNYASKMKRCISEIEYSDLNLKSGFN